MKLDSYFKNLPNMWSANFLAILGFVSFILAIIAVSVSSYYSVEPFSFPKTFEEVHRSIESCIIAHIFLFPLTCVHGIIPIIIQYLFLSKAKLQNNIAFIIMIVITILCTIPGYNLFDSSSGSGIYIAFVPILGLPVTIIAFIIFFILLYRDLKNRKQLSEANCIANPKRIANHYYINFVNIFFWYGTILFILEFLLLIYTFFF